MGYFGGGHWGASHYKSYTFDGNPFSTGPMLYTIMEYVAERGFIVYRIEESQAVEFYGYTGWDDDEIQSLVVANVVLKERNFRINTPRRISLFGEANVNPNDADPTQHPDYPG